MPLALVLLLALPHAMGSMWSRSLAPPGVCQTPAVCTPPNATYSVVRPVPSRQQWEDSGGYCGSLSIQSICMSYGAYISQQQVDIEYAKSNFSHRVSFTAESGSHTWVDPVTFASDKSTYYRCVPALDTTIGGLFR